MPNEWWIPSELLTSSKISVKGAVPQHQRTPRSAMWDGAVLQSVPAAPAQLSWGPSAQPGVIPRWASARPQPNCRRPAPHLVDVVPHPLPQPLQVHPPADRVRARSPPRWQRSPLRPAGRAPAVPCRAEPPLPAPLGADCPLPDGSRTPNAAFRERGGCCRVEGMKDRQLPLNSVKSFLPYTCRSADLSHMYSF